MRRKERHYWGSALNCCLDCWKKHSKIKHSAKRMMGGVLFVQNVDEYFEMAESCDTCEGTGRQQIPMAEVIASMREKYLLR